MNPAITKEKILQEERERKTIAIDKELHQDHYQTRIQPVIDKKILAEEHKHHIVPVEYREHHHNKKADIARLIEKEVSS